MKVMKKIAAVVLAVSLAVPFVGVQAEAADGTLMFSDPQTKVGEKVSVDLVVQTDPGVTDPGVTDPGTGGMDQNGAAGGETQ